ncbi:hypothetical protein LWI28_012084 [Acer negundo]|uniref:U6 snRNA-associated Sm-like protein LSm8 n=1 Tax=Acer negundo TaxID=4023 RepID=A0AAD5JN20_ACENE|nr:hypothetical protein LWI28_012084 [Acer negundo]
METLSTPLVSLPIQANPEAPTVKSNNRDRLVLSLIDRCISLKQLKQVHAHMLRTVLFFDAYSDSKLFTASTLFPFSSLEYARKVFDEIPEPNLYTWNILIRTYSWSPESGESGILKGFDQATNIILDESHERVYSTKEGVQQLVLGLYIIRGDNL